MSALAPRSVGAAVMLNCFTRKPGSPLARIANIFTNGRASVRMNNPKRRISSRMLFSSCFERWIIAGFERTKSLNQLFHVRRYFS
ncbi:hypothetical protein PMAYCL1PPCAC_13877, partial [Pristionchus mayeri]